MSICESCGVNHDGSFGSGRFCSRGCANRRNHSNETKDKISDSVKVHNMNRYNYEYSCPVCGRYWHSKRKVKGDGRPTTCKNCKRNVKRRNDNAKSIKDLSKRTVSKIFRRAEYSCVLCGWDKSVCDIHHIIGIKNGGTDDMNNLIGICPNCHRVIHSEKEYDISFLNKLSLGNVFIDWKNFYKN